MTTHEAIEIIQVAKAQVEWDLPLDYAAAFDKAIDALNSAAEEKVQSERIRRALKVCSINDCENCPYLADEMCVNTLTKDAYEMIERLEARDKACVVKADSC